MAILAFFLSYFGSKKTDEPITCSGNIHSLKNLKECPFWQKRNVSHHITWLSQWTWDFFIYIYRISTQIFNKKPVCALCIFQSHVSYIGELIVINDCLTFHKAHKCLMTLCGFSQELLFNSPSTWQSAGLQLCPQPSEWLDQQQNVSWFCGPPTQGDEIVCHCLYLNL